MYIAAGQGQTTPRDKILMSTETSCHFGHLLQVPKKVSLKSNFIQCFYDFIHVYSPGAEADSPPPPPHGTKLWFQLKCLVNSFICCKFKRKCLWTLILYNYFHDLIHVYSPGAGVDSPPGTKFLCQQKDLITLPMCCKFQRNLFEVWFYTFFFMI